MNLLHAPHKDSIYLELIVSFLFAGFLGVSHHSQHASVIGVTRNRTEPRVTGRSGPGRFGPESFRPGRFGPVRFGPGSFRPILVGRFGLIFFNHRLVT